MPLSSIETAQLYSDLPAYGSPGRRIYVQGPTGRTGMYLDTGSAWVRDTLPDQDAIFNEIMGFKAQNMPLYAGDTALALTSQTVQYTLIPLRKGDIVSSLSFFCTVVPATITTIKAGLYATDGQTRLATSANSTTAFAAKGLGTISFSSAYTATANGFVYAALLSHATTAGTFSAAANQANKDGTTGLGVAIAGTLSGQTDLTATATITAASQPLWVAWS